VPSRHERWLRERYDLETIARATVRKPVPLHRHSIWYLTGGLTLFLFVIQIVTGLALSFFYRPTEDGAHESILFITTEADFGWLVRSIHVWGANLLLGSVFFHMAAVFFLRAYRRPRELTWLTGAALLLVMMGFGFSGSLLPWDTFAFFATRVGTEVMRAAPVLGAFALRLLRGGEEITGATLTRFYALHVILLPLAGVILVAIHLVLVQMHGMSVPGNRAARGTAPFFPHFFLRDLVVWVIAFGALVTLAVLKPEGLGEKANALSPAPAGIRPEWYFLFLFQMLRLMPGTIGGIPGEMIVVGVTTVLGAAWLLWPFIDRAEDRRPRFVTALGIIALVAFLFLTVMAYVTTRV
jgi:cytochrome b6